MPNVDTSRLINAELADDSSDDGRQPSYKYTEKDTVKISPFIKTQAEKDAYQDSMMAEVMKLRPLPVGRDIRDMTDYSVGAIPLDYGVSGSGARTYSVPIFTAPDVNYAPSLSLVYNSQGGYGYMGYGWDIAGLSEITLSSKTTYWDGVIEAPDSSDRDGVFSLDGVRLVTNLDPATSASYPLVTATGHILVAPHRGLSGYINSFTALYPDGATAVYGMSVDNRFTMPVYPVVSTTNINGDRIEYTYTFTPNFDEDARPTLTGVRYGFDAAGNASASIIFSSNISYSGVFGYYAGRKMTRKPIISTITSKSGGVNLYTYSFSNIFPASINASLLTSISVTNSSGESLPPLTFTYGYDNDTPSGTSHLQLADSITLQRGITTNPIFRRGKFVPGSYDDGLVGYAGINNYTQIGYHKYAYSYPADSILAFIPSLTNPDVRFSISPPSGFLTAEAVDVDGDGVDEMVIVSCLSTNNDGSRIKISVWKYNPLSANNVTVTSFEVTLKGRIYNGIHYSPSQRAFRWGDFRGDGTTQMLAMCYSKNCYEYGQTSWTSLVDLATGELLDEIGTQPVTFNQDRRIVCQDIDGDGRTELCIAAVDRMYVYRYENDELADDGWINVIHSDIIDTDRSYFADINADGYIDIIQASHYDDRWYFHYNTGIGFAQTDTMHICNYQADDRFMFMDIDRDGYPDLVQLRDSDILYYRNINGVGFSYYSTTATAIPDNAVLLPPNVVEHSAMSSFVTVYGKYVRIYDYTSYVPPLRHLVQSCDSFGKIVRNTYGYLPKSSTYWTGNTTVSADDGYQLRVLPIYVLTGAKGFMSETATTPSGLQETYSWYDGVVHTQGLGFCGFAKTQTSSNLDGVYHNTISVYNPQKRGVLMSVSLYSRYINHGPLATTTYSYDNNTFNGKLAPRLTQTDVTQSIDGVLSTTTYTYRSGNFDFPTKVTTLKSCTLNGAQVITKDIVETTYQHSNTPTRYVLGIVSSQDSFHDRDGDGISKMGERVVYTRDTLFRPITQHTYRLERASDNSQPTAHLSSTDRWQYDSHGNVIREESAPSGSMVFTGKSYAYDNSGRHLISSTDALGHTTTYSGFDQYGNPSIVTNHKGQLTHSYRDGWGRVTRTVHPDGTVDSLARAWGGSGVYRETSTSSGAPDVIIDYDAACREVLHAKRRFDGQWQKVATQYDQRGHRKKVSLPYRGTSPTYWTTYTYDEYGRLGLVSEPSGRMTRWKRTGTTVTETKDNIKTTRKTGPDGELRIAADSLSTVTYFYRDDGQPMLVGKTGLPATTFTYDTLGRRTSIVDPSAGTRSTSYATNANGTSTITESNALGSIATHYDSLGRMSSIIRPDFNTSFTYDTCGRLVSKISTNGTLSRYTYDAYDRPLSVKDSVPGGRWLQKAFIYDTYGRTSSVSYTNHNGYITSELYYYANGHNYKTTLPDGTVIYQLSAENDLGQPTAATSGGVTRTYGYTEYGLPTFRKLNGGALMDHSYTFDATTGNLLSRSRTYGGNTTTENFSYDNLGRLTSAANNNITYDTNNNITSMGGMGTMAYQDGDHPYRITDLYATSTSPMGTAQQSVTYTAYDRPSTIVQGDKSASFTYDADHDRVRTHITRWGENIDRYYIGGRYEINDDVMDGLSEWLYLGGDAYTAPMVLFKGQNWTQWQPYVIGRDYLGSINVLAISGALQSGGNFDAWGRGSTSFYINRGWCGHEHLEDFGLINMNARLYDPVLGRFLSPDPYVQSPDFPGNFNRYSYCLNNPLKYNDRTGELFGIDDAILIAAAGAIIGGVVGGYQGYKLGKANGATGDEMFGYIYCGVLIGCTSAMIGGYVGAAVAPMVAAAGYGGFLGGAFTGAFSGAAAGAVNGLGFGALSTGTIDGAINAGAQGMALGIFSGAAMGGAIQGVAAKVNGKSFWTGKEPRPTIELSQQTVRNDSPIKIRKPTIPKASNLNEPIQYDFVNDPDGSYVTLYRGTTGTESGNAPLYMTDSPEYAATYISNEGTLVQVKIPKSTLELMYYNQDVSIKNGLHFMGNDANPTWIGGLEYIFAPSIKTNIVNLFTPY
jgi:RHS repeat-associated protein